ncbi:ATP-binding protein [Weissella oryzae SG25]|uniref:tRNA threonylcarbamoyladenosine biosynthesis protein TsaE n=2 Tax=Weissella TaxID=46255 RepID=A0A069CVM9_WEIOS|nr:ATP-binding protein [Weissella oryzae SG25]
MFMRIIVNNLIETQNIAAQLARLIQPGDTVLLDGELGAGKTTFTQGFARELGIKRPLKSPTFTLVREYTTSAFRLYHLDVYRLGESSDDELGLEDYFTPDSVAFVEWSQYISSILPQDALRITLRRLDNDLDANKRMIEFEATGIRSVALLAELKGIISNGN